MIRLISIAAAVVLLAAGSLSLALAQDPPKPPKAIGRYGDWQALTFEEAGNIACYMISEPKQAQGNYSTRGKVYALITHRPSSKQLNVLTIIAGYPYKEKSEVTVEIGDEKFSLFTEKETAWAPDAETDQKLVDAMKKGSGMIIRGVSTRDTETTDTYSLQGFTKAYNAIGEACGL
jgi:invasion protein IalB